MIGGKKHEGYTVTEVLIVIAVTGLMFVSATVVFSDKQQQVQFDQAVREFESTIRDVMNDVSTGYYPSNAGVSCDVTGNEVDRPDITVSGSNELGKNAECIYVGKAIHFVPDNGPEGNSSFNVVNLVGKRFLRDGSLEVADELDEVKPVAVYETNSFDDNYVRYGVDIKKVIEKVDITPNEYGVIVFLANFEGANTAGAAYQAQSVKTHGLWSASTVLGSTVTDAATLIDAINGDSIGTEGYIGGAYSVNNSGITVCLTDGERNASVTIGESGAESTVLRIGDVESECL